MRENPVIDGSELGPTLCSHDYMPISRDGRRDDADHAQTSEAHLPLSRVDRSCTQTWGSLKRIFSQEAATLVRFIEIETRRVRMLLVLRLNAAITLLPLRAKDAPVNPFAAGLQLHF